MFSRRFGLTSNKVYNVARSTTTFNSGSKLFATRYSSKAVYSANAPLKFWVNGKQQSLNRVDPDTYLIDHLRSTGKKGVKLACGEGGCGACTVTVTNWDAKEKKFVHRPLNSCLVSLPSVEGMHITTVEAIGNVRDGLHEVQKQMAGCFGSQCGYCTPGFVMSLYTALLKNPKASAVELEKSIDGNLCRCTGYRPIADAVRALSHDENNGKRKEIADATTPLLPSAMRDAGVDSTLHLRGARSEWFAPRTLDELLALRQEYPDARIVVGNTEVGVEQRFKHAQYNTLITPQHVPELHELSVSDDGTLRLGGAADLTRIWAWLDEAAAANASLRETVRAITDQIFWFSGTSIRSGASLAGNIVTASPISDLNPVWVTLDAYFVLRSAARGERRVKACKFFTGYRETALEPDELLVAVEVPPLPSTAVVRSYKQGQRREDDIAIVTACYRIDRGDDGVVTRARFALGGVAPLTVRAKDAEKELVGKKFTDETFEAARAAMAKQFTLPQNVPGGRAEYRCALTISFLYKLKLALMGDNVSTREQSALKSNVSHSVPRGLQQWQPRPDSDKPVGEPALHSSATKQVTGEAEYVDDLPHLPDELAGALVTSSRASAVLKSIDASDALAMPGVVGVYTAEHVPGDQLIGDIIVDEAVFARDRVEFVGQTVAIVVAESDELAHIAARAVKVEYEDAAEPPVLTIEDAVKRNSFFEMHDHKIEKGDVDTAMANAAHVIEGTVRLGGQEHFYFEPMVTLAQPVDGGEMHIFSSTQNLSKTQHSVAAVLGLPMNQVSCRTRRIGGGFGGKETSNIILACQAAVASHHVRAPVRLLHSRDEDMQITGKRHPFVGKYKVGFDENGVVQAVDVDLINNGGYSFDLSGPVVDRAIFHSDNAYFMKNARIRGRIAKTNLPSNTAFRGFGGPQGMLVAEHWIEHIAHTLGVRPEVVRQRNLYSTEGERNLTHYNQAVDSDMDALWKKCVDVSDYEKRLTAVEQFNSENKWRKRGLALVPTKFGLAFTFTTLNQASALVHIYTDGSVLVNHGGIEMGQGLHIKVLQVAAHTLGVPLDQVYLQDTSTEKIANSSATAASMGSDLYGMATLKACEKLVARLKPIREELGKDATFKDVVTQAYLRRVSLSAHAHWKTPIDGYNFDTKEGQPFNYFTSGAALAEVELDTLTGDWRALRADVVMDIGTSINPSIDIGQIEGAFVQGQGWLTTEDLVFGGAEHEWLPDGKLFAPGPGSYKIPALDDIPREFNVHLMPNVANPRAVHSSRGVGEPPLMLSGSVLFALRDAVRAARKETGDEKTLMPFDAPLTSERLRMACLDENALIALKKTDKPAVFQAKGSF